MPNIHQAVLIGASAKKVYAALTTQEGLAGWWTPAATTDGETATFPFGDSYFKLMKVTSLIPNQQVNWLCLEAADEWIGTTISFQLYAVKKEKLYKEHPELSDQLNQLKGTDETTLLVFYHDGWKDYTTMFAECSYTWGRFLYSLKLFCETGKGSPWPRQH